MRNTISAPYAANPIPLYLASLTGTRFRIMNCLECGAEFLERSSDSVFRLNDASQPNIWAISSSPMTAVCGRCSQQYRVSVSLDVTILEDSIPLYMQPQSLYIDVSPHKTLRDIHCLECGRPFQTISDRISQVIDNRVPFEYLRPSRLGPIQCLCHNSKCGQTWALMT